MTEEDVKKFKELQDKYTRITEGKEKLEKDFHKKVSMMQDDI